MAARSRWPYWVRVILHVYLSCVAYLSRSVSSPYCTGKPGDIYEITEKFEMADMATLFFNKCMFNCTCILYIRVSINVMSSFCSWNAHILHNKRSLFVWRSCNICYSCPKEHCICSLQVGL